MRAILTGGSGQVGEMLRRTASPDTEVVSIPREVADLSDPDSLRRSIISAAPDAVINAAAYTAVDRAETEPGMAYRINHLAVRTLADICSAAGIPLVHFSTDFVFDGRSSTPYRTDSQKRPLSTYGKSKALGEDEVVCFSKNLLIRTAWVYAEGHSNFVNTMLRLMSDGRPINVVSDQIGTPTYAKTLAAATWSMIGHGARGTFHYTDAGVASWYDFAVAIQEEALDLGLLAHKSEIRPIATSEYPTPAVRPKYGVLDKGSCWALLGKPAEHWRSNLRECLMNKRDLADG